MIVQTLQEDGISFQVSLDDQVLYKVTDFPKKFVLEFPNSKSYWISQEPLDFLSNRRFILSNLEASELAVIKTNVLHSFNGLEIGQDTYSIKSNTASILDIFRHRRSLEVEGLGIECDIIEKFLSIRLATKVDNADEIFIATVILLQYARTCIWRES